jgi:hypothetical protein
MTNRAKYETWVFVRKGPIRCHVRNIQFFLRMGPIRFHVRNILKQGTVWEKSVFFQNGSTQIFCVGRFEINQCQVECLVNVEVAEPPTIKI